MVSASARRTPPPPVNSPAPHNRHPLHARLRAELGLKLALTVALYVCVYAPYQLLQRHQFFPATEMPLSQWDRAIPFWPQSVWVYLSIYLFMPLAPFVMRERRQLLRYARGLVAISLVADAVFIFWPTTCPRPAAADVTGLYRVLTAIDNPFHACPSLHAAFAVFSALVADLVTRELKLPSRWRIAAWTWTALILLATLTTKQHTLADLAAGGALAFVAFACVLRKPVPVSPREPDDFSVNAAQPNSTHP